MFRTSGDRTKKVKICPGCNALDSIIFSERAGNQKDLLGRVMKTWRALAGPKCCECGKTFPKNYHFKEMAA